MSEVAPPAQAPQDEAQPEPEEVKEPESPTVSKLKQMRRVAAKQEPPEDKNQLIQFLSDRIKQAQDALNDTEQLLECEVKQREKISGKIQQRNSQLEKLYAVDQKGLPDKIKEKLTEILTNTISQKIDAEEQLTVEKTKNYQYHQMYHELKWEEKQSGTKLTEQQTKQEAITAEITALQEQNAAEQAALTEAQKEFQELKEKKEALENKYLQMRVALSRMGDVKAVLNRFFGNQDLFDEKMELKEQRVQRPEVVSIQNLQRTENKQSRTKTRLKPIAKTPVQDDEDFWRGDFTKGRY